MRIWRPEIKTALHVTKKYPTQWLAKDIEWGTLQSWRKEGLKKYEPPIEKTRKVYYDKAERTGTMKLKDFQKNEQAIIMAILSPLMKPNAP